MKKCKRHRYKDAWVIQGRVDGVYQFAKYKLCLNCDVVFDTLERRQSKELPDDKEQPKE